MKPQAYRDTVALYQALSPQQLAALIRADWKCIEPGGDDRLFIYLKLSQRYAEMIVRQREVPLHGAGYVVRILLPGEVIRRYELETVAYQEHLEYRLPVAELPRLDRCLAGEVQLVSAFREQNSYSIPAGSRPLASLMG